MKNVSKHSLLVRDEDDRDHGSSFSFQGASLHGLLPSGIPFISAVMHTDTQASQPLETLPNNSIIVLDNSENTVVTDNPGEASDPVSITTPVATDANTQPELTNHPVETETNIHEASPADAPSTSISAANESDLATTPVMEDHLQPVTPVYAPAPNGPGTGSNVSSDYSSDPIIYIGNNQSNSFVAPEHDTTSYHIIGNWGADTLTGGAGDDIIVGNRLGDGNDPNDANLHPDGVANSFQDEVTPANTYGDVLSGGAGNDTIVQFDQATVNGGDGDDSIFDYGYSISGGRGYSLPVGGHSVVDGGNGNDYIGVHNGIVHGGNGQDTIDGSLGGGRLFGDGGDDNIVQVTHGEAHGGEGNDRIEAVNDLIVSSSTNATRYIASDTLYGDAGNDTLSGAFGGDHLYGGAGADTFVFDINRYPISIGHDAQGELQVTQLDSTDIIHDFAIGEDQISLTGATAAQVNDMLAHATVGYDGRGHSYTELSLPGTEGHGHIRIEGLAPGQLHASDFGFADIAASYDQHLQGIAGAETYSLGNPDYYSHYYADADGKYHYESLEDQSYSIDSGTGNDFFMIGAGNFQLFGGDGDDGFYGDNLGNRDTSDNHVVIDAGAGNDYVSINQGQNAVIFGGDGNDTLAGNGANDIINGGNGDDLVAGYSQVGFVDYNGPYSSENTLAVLTGGAGADTFAFNLQWAHGFNTDTASTHEFIVTDFDINQDSMALSNYRTNNGDAEVTLVNQSAITSIEFIQSNGEASTHFTIAPQDGAASFGITLVGVSQLDLSHINWVSPYAA